MGADHKLQGLQAARAIAALSVAYFHSYVAVRAAFPESAWHAFAPLQQYGYLGVNFFFAISGYVICLVASKRSFTLGGFVIKRLFRLYPMYWLTMGVVAVMIAFGKYRAEPLGHFLYSMTLLPQQGIPAYDPSWTLERELVFYALAAAVVPLAGIPGLAITLCGLAFAGWYLGQPWSFHLLSLTQADFLAGVLVFLGRHHLKRIGSLVPIGTGLALLVWTRSHGFAAAEALSMGLILAGFINLDLPWRHAPLRWLVAAGDASYSLYLLHYLIFYGAAVVSVRLLSLPEWACEPWRFATLLVACLISYGTFRIIERPAIILSEQIADRRQRELLVAP